MHGNFGICNRTRFRELSKYFGVPGNRIICTKPYLQAPMTKKDDVVKVIPRYTPQPTYSKSLKSSMNIPDSMHKFFYSPRFSLFLFLVYKVAIVVTSPVILRLEFFDMLSAYHSFRRIQQRGSC